MKMEFENDKELKKKIKLELLNKSFYEDIKNSLYERKLYKVLSDIFEFISMFSISISIIFAFASGFYNFIVLSFVAGCLSTVGLIFDKLSKFSAKESKERTERINIILENLEMNRIPDIIGNIFSTKNLKNDIYFDNLKAVEV